MGKLLKLTAALDTARSDAKAAEAAHKAEPGNRILRATFLGCIHAVLSAASAIAKADKGASAKMKKITEKYSQKSERLEESDSEEEEEEESVASTQDSSETSSVESSEEEEEEESKSKPMPSEEEEEEEEASAEEEEEKAIAKAWIAAEKAYAKAAKGADAYGVFGPKGVRKALGKATGETSMRAALGALHALPRKAKADAAVAKDVEALKAKNIKADVEAIVQSAKADGRASSPALRAELREMGTKMGAKYLKGFVAKLPKAGRTAAYGAIRERLNEEGVPDAGAQAEMMDRFTAGMSDKDKAAFEASFKEKMRAKTNGAAGRA